MRNIVKILITVIALISQSYAICENIKSTELTLGNARSIASKVNSIESFINRSVKVGEGLYLKNSKAIADGDDRKVKDKNSPRYLDAVGRLRVIDDKGTVNICGGSLVGFVPNQDSQIVMTSLHCMQGEATWTSITKDGKTVKRNILKILDFNRGSDYAILLLDKKVDFNDIAPLLIDYEAEMTPDEVIGDTEYGDPEFAFAGYSADVELGKGGSVLTYDTSGEVATSYSRESDPVGGVTSDVTTYAGASGGALIVTYTEEEDDFRPVNKGRQSYLMGIIKGGTSNDFSSSNGVQGSHNTRFVDYERFRAPLKNILKKYNGAVEGI